MKKYFSIILVSCAMLFQPFNLKAQNLTGEIYGEVVDVQSQLSLPGATLIVSWKDGQQQAISDERGLFRIDEIPVGRIRVEVSYVGYHPLVMDHIQLTTGKDLRLQFELHEKLAELDEVVVKAFTKDRAINEFASVSSRSFSIEETNRFAGSWGDPARMVSNYAGVVSASDQRNDIIIRGNSPTGLLWRVDGMAIPSPNHFGTFGTTGGPISILNNNQLTNSDFFTSAFPAEYGNALGGAFDLKMRPGNSQDYEFMGQMGFNGFELGAEGPLSRKSGASFIVNYRYTMMDLMHAMGMFDVGGIPKYTDLSFKLHLPTEKMGTFSVIGIGGNSNIELEEDKGSGWTSDMLQGTQVFYGSRMGMLGLTHRYHISDRSRVESSLSTSYSNSFNDVDSLYGEVYDDFYRDSYTQTKYSLTSKLITKLNAKNTFQAGIIADLYDFSFFDEVYISPMDRIISLTDISEQSLLLQAFIQAKHRFSESLTLNLGMHSQFFALNQSKILEPRLGLTYSPNAKHSFKLGYGLHGQTQPMLVYFRQTLTDTLLNEYSQTNSELDFSKSHHWVAGYDYKISSNLRAKVEAYYQYLYDIPVEQTESFYSIANYGAAFYNEKTDSLVNGGIGKNMGVELTLEKFLSKNFYFLLTTTLYESKYQGSDEEWRNTAFNGNFVVNFLTGYEIPIKDNVLAFNVKAVWAGGKPYLPIDLSASIDAGETVYDYDEAYAMRYADYFRIDTRISFRQNTKNVSQEWSFDVQNMTNHKNLLTQKYDVGTESIVDVPQMELFMIGSWKIYF